MEKTKQSTIYVKVPITATVAGTPIDVTTDLVYLAIVAKGTTSPADGDWKTAEWETADGVTSARLLVGPEDGDVDPAVGKWDVWSKVVDSPEVPVNKAGTLTVK